MPSGRRAGGDWVVMRFQHALAFFAGALPLLVCRCIVCLHGSQGSCQAGVRL